jgi:hypothetical protein
MRGLAREDVEERLLGLGRAIQCIQKCGTLDTSFNCVGFTREKAFELLKPRLLIEPRLPSTVIRHDASPAR